MRESIRKVWYLNSDGTREAAHVITKHTDDIIPYYTIRVGDREIQTIRERLRSFRDSLKRHKRSPQEQNDKSDA